MWMVQEFAEWYQFGCWFWIFTNWARICDVFQFLSYSTKPFPAPWYLFYASRSFLLDQLPWIWRIMPTHPARYSKSSAFTCSGSLWFDSNSVCFPFSFRYSSFFIGTGLRMDSNWLDLSPLKLLLTKIKSESVLARAPFNQLTLIIYEKYLKAILLCRIECWFRITDRS